MPDHTVDEATLMRRLSDVMGEDLDDLIEAKRAHTQHFLELQAQVEHLEKMRKVVYADVREDLRVVLVEDGQNPTETKLDHLARKHPRYREVLQTLYEKRKALAPIEAAHYRDRDRLDILKAGVFYAAQELRDYQTTR